MDKRNTDPTYENYLSEGEGLVVHEELLFGPTTTLYWIAG